MTEMVNDRRNEPQYGQRASLINTLLCESRLWKDRSVEESILQHIWSKIVHETIGDLRNSFDANYNDPRPALPEERIDVIIAESLAEYRSALDSVGTKLGISVGR